MKIFFCQGLSSTNFQLVDVCLDVTSLYYNPDFFRKHYFVFSYSNSYIELKMKVDKTYVCSIYVLFPEGCDRTLKFVLLSKFYQQQHANI